MGDAAHRLPEKARLQPPKQLSGRLGQDDSMSMRRMFSHWGTVKGAQLHKANNSELYTSNEWMLWFINWSIELLLKTDCLRY